MKRENIKLAKDIDEQLNSIETMLSCSSIKDLYEPNVMRVLQFVGFEKIRPILEERKRELEEQLSKL